MNRIRETTTGYEVLTTPHRKYDVGFEFMLGSWTDEGLKGFEVYEYDNYADAECEALKHPDINWEQLHEFHKDPYYLFRNIVGKVLDYSKITCNFLPNLMTPTDIKHTMMDRVLKSRSDNSFRLAYDMNDIITFVITNPWSSNLRKIRTFLSNESRLNIYKTYETNKIIHMVGRTDIGTTYEIILCPDIIHNWVIWKRKNSNRGAENVLAELRKALTAQKLVDQTDPVV